MDRREEVPARDRPGKIRAIFEPDANFGGTLSDVLVMGRGHGRNGSGGGRCRPETARGGGFAAGITAIGSRPAGFRVRGVGFW
jgi:hypothetical protein